MLSIYGSFHSLDLQNSDLSRMSTLKRICLCALTSTVRIDAILNANKSLHQIAFIPNVCNPPVPSFADEVVKDITKRYILEQKSLEFFYVSTRRHFEAICDGIHRGIFMTKKLARKQMEITLNVDIQEISSAEEFVCSISKIVQILGISEIEEWIVCVDAHYGSRGLEVFDLDPMKLVLEELARSIDNVSLIKGSIMSLVIGNAAEMSRHVHWWHQPIHIPYY